MKKLLKQVFFWESPAEGAVFATLLFWLGAWCLASVFLIADGLPACFPGTVGMSPYGKPAFAWQRLLLVAEGLLCLYHLAVTDRFYRGLVREKWLLGKYVLAGIYLVIVAAFAFSFFHGGVFFFIALYLLWCWAAPFLFMPKQWKWLIPAALTGTELLRLGLLAVCALLLWALGAAEKRVGYTELEPDKT